MKNTFVLFVLVCGVLITSGYAATKAGYQPATVVSVESRAIPSNYVGDNPSDAPSQAEVYSYDIAILVGGTVYRASYDFAFAELPSAFAPNQSVQVNLQKHVMDVELPCDRTADGDRGSHRRQKRIPLARQLGRWQHPSSRGCPVQAPLGRRFR
jgi:hypothetical protein